MNDVWQYITTNIELECIQQWKQLAFSLILDSVYIYCAKEELEEKKTNSDA